MDNTAVVKASADIEAAIATLAAPVEQPALCAPAAGDPLQDLAVAAELACVMAISHRAAGALLADSHALVGLPPLTLVALGAGTIHGNIRMPGEVVLTITASGSSRAKR